MSPAPDPESIASPRKAILLGIVFVAFVVAIFGGLYWATHAPVAAPEAVPDGYDGPIPNFDVPFR